MPPSDLLAILSDGDILALVRGGRLTIEPFREENLTPNGYDLTIEQVLVGQEGRPQGGKVEVPPLTWFAVGTLEVVGLGPNLAGELWLRTSLARKGVLASFGRVDAGFRGNLTLSAFNASSRSLSIAQGTTFAQIVFDELRTPAQGTYGKRSGRYQDQRGVTLTKD